MARFQITVIMPNAAFAQMCGYPLPRVSGTTANHPRETDKEQEARLV